jgi:gliding motility-associated-like protein
MFLRSFFSLIIIFLVQVSFGQNLQWVKKMGGSRLNVQNSTVDDHGNFYTTGSLIGSVDVDPSSNTFLLTSKGQKDILVAKYDKDGNFKWAFNIGSTSHDAVDDIVVDKTGNIVITGYFRGTGIDFDPSPATALLNSNGESGSDPGFGGDIFVAKYDTLGNYKWAFNVGGTALSETGSGVGIDNNNNVLVTGYFASPADFDPSSSSAILYAANGPLFVAKYSENGQYQWAFNTGQPGVDNAGWDVVADNANNVIVTGFFQGSNIDFNPSSTAIFPLSSNGSQDIFLAKYDPAGAFIWAFNAGGSSIDVGRVLAVNSTNEIYVGGDYGSSTMDISPGSSTTLLTGSGSGDIFLAKYSSGGQLIWGFDLGASGTENGWAIDLDDNQNILIAGTFSGTNVDFNPSPATANLTAQGSGDGVIAKYNPAGQYVCAFKVGGTSFDEAYNVTAWNDFIYISGGFAGTADFDPGSGTTTLNTPSEDAYFGKYSWSSNPPAGTIAGSTICLGQVAQMTFTATSGAGPFSLVISNGSHSYTYSNVQSGVPFNLVYSPLQTTTYNLVSIQESGSCSPVPGVGTGSATITVSCGPENCSNGIDDDGDGLIDCADPDCIGCTTPCGPIPSINPKIFNTGNNGNGGLLAVGVNDRHWTISNSLGGTPRNTFYTGNCAAGYWTPTPYPDAGWITDRALNTCGAVIPQNDSSHRYFSTSFNVPASLVSSLRLSFDVYADNFVGQVYLNGVPLGIRETSRNVYCAGCNISFTINSGFVAGVNTLTILVLQQPIPEIPSGNQNMGLLVNASASLDSDGDGVVDGVDRCPGTPPGVGVDAFGCYDINVTTNTPLCNGDSLVLESSNAGTGSTYTWTTPSGTTLTGKRVVIQNMTSSGSGRYYVTITDGYGCTRMDSTDVMVSPPPVVTVTPNSSVCSGNTIQLNATGGTTYRWFPSTGLNNPNISNPIATVTSAITYKVVVTNAGGCRDSANTTISINAGPAITHSGNAQICQGDSVQLSAGGGASYQWFPATGLNSATISNPKASPAATTTYKVIVTGANGCKDSMNLTVTVATPPVVTITAAGGGLICPGDSVQLTATGTGTMQWTPAAGLNNAQIANPKAFPSVTTLYSLTVVNGGCQATASVTVTVKPKPVASASAAVQICASDTTQLAASGGIAYQWIPATGLSNASIADPKAFPAATTVYSVVVSNAEGCRDTATTIVTVTAKPSLNIGNDTTLCINNSYTLNATLNGANDYEWNTGDVTPTISINTPGMYSVVVKIAGCNTPVKDTIIVQALPLPVVSAGNDTSGCINSPLLIRATGTDITNYLWSTGSNQSSIIVTSDGTYRITASNDCGSSTDEVIVRMVPCSEDLFFPSAFTPNGNGRNDVFKAGYMTNPNLAEYELKVYNRWGALVFSTNEVSKGWDGIYNGVKQNTAAFVWIARYRKASGGPAIIRKGTVTLIH